MNDNRNDSNSNDVAKCFFSDLEGKTIFVTGAMRGIGREIALMLAKNRVNVVFSGTPSEKNRDQVIVFKKELEDIGEGKVKATPLLFDISNYEETQASINSLLKEGIQITGLVNNAGISKDQLILKLKQDDIDKVLDTNLKGAIYVTSLLSRHFLRVANEGKSISVVNISSVVGLMGNVAQTVYAASKSGLIGFSKSFAKEMSSRRIRCNVICPGFIETDMTTSLSDKVKEEFIASVPLGRVGKASEVAALTTFLLSDCSSYITGDVIKIDGGLYI